MNQYAVISWVIVLLISSCVSVQHHPAVTSISINTITETQALQYRIKNYRYIPLETNEECYIGKIDKIQAVGSHFYVLDAAANSIFLFDENGRFVSKLQKHGNGPGEYNYIMDFDVDSDGNILIADMHTRSILLYDIQGEFLKRTRLTYYPQNIAYADSAVTIYQPHPMDSDENDKLIRLTADGKKQFSFFNTNLAGHSLQLSKPFSLTNSDGVVMFNDDASDIIYELVDGGLSEKFKIDFGQYTLNNDQREDKAYFRKGVTNIEEGWRIHNFFQTADYFTVSFNYKRKTWTLFRPLDRGEDLLVSCASCGVDTIKMLSEFKPLGTHGNYFISKFDYQLIKFLKTNGFKQSGADGGAWDAEIATLMNTIQENDNPVLFLYELN